MKPMTLKENVEWLFKMISVKEDHYEVTENAEKRLIVLGKREGGFEEVVKGLESESHHVRISTSRALGYIEDFRAIEPLKKLLGDPVGNVQVFARDAIGRLEDLQAMGDDEKLKVNVRKLYRRDPTQPKKEGEDDRWDVERAIHEFEERKDKRAVVPLARIIRLDWRGNSERKEAAKCLGVLKEPKAIPDLGDAIFRNMKYEHLNEVVAACTWALGEIGDLAAEPYLVKALKMEMMPIHIRAGAARSLGKIKSFNSVDLLMEEYANALNGPEETKRANDTFFGRMQVREEICKSFGDLLDKRAIPILINAMYDINHDVPDAARDSLLKFGGEVIESVKKAIMAVVEDTDETKRAIIRWMEVLTRIGGEDAKAALCEILQNHTFYSARGEAAEALGELKGGEEKSGVDSVLVLIRELEKEDGGSVNIDIIRALAKLKDLRAIVPLVIEWATKDYLLCNSECEKAILEITGSKTRLQLEDAVRMLPPEQAAEMIRQAYASALAGEGKIDRATKLANSLNNILPRENGKIAEPERPQDTSRLLARHMGAVKQVI